MDYDTLAECTYLDLCMKEALRMRPPLVTVMRKVIKEQSYNGKRIPEGHYLCCSPWANGTIEEVFPEPDKFDPTRYTKEKDQPKKGGQFSYVPFGAGRTQCIGKRFAEIQVQTIWSTILRDYDLELVTGFPKTDFTTLIVTPEHPVTVRYKKRKK
jgi:sterol 14alpha-demethylase